MCLLLLWGASNASQTPGVDNWRSPRGTHPREEGDTLRYAEEDCNDYDHIVHLLLEVLFERHAGSWRQRQKLYGEPDSYFGGAVALSAEALVIGAPGNGQRGAQAGAAYLFERYAPPADPQTLLGTAIHVNDLLGSSVAISGRTVAVGAPSDIRLQLVQGSVYIFQE